MPISNEPRPANEVMCEIHEKVDMDLVEQIVTMLNSKGKLKTSVVSATLAYMLADAIVQGLDSHDQICLLSQTYGEYIHRCAHGLKMADEPADGESKH